MIATISGAHGIGKTTIARGILAALPLTQILPSVCTFERLPRSTDMPGEYIYQSNEDFEALKRGDFFLWAVNIRRVQRGTTRLSVNLALNSEYYVFVAILTPEGVRTLTAHAKTIGKENSLFSFYILSPGAGILSERLHSRGDSPEEVEAAIKECADWDKEALASHIPFRFINNSGPIVEKAVAKITDVIRSYLIGP